MQRNQVTDRLFYEGIDLRLLSVGGVDLDVEVFEHVIDVRRHIGGAMRAAHHHSVTTAVHATCQSRDTDTAGQRGPCDECNHGIAVEQATAERCTVGSRHWGIHGRSFICWGNTVPLCAVPVSPICAAGKVL
jgi:hypothetical protein